MKEVKVYKLSSANELIGNTWKLCKKKWKDLLAISTLTVLLIHLINFIDFYYLKNVDQTIPYLIQALVWILSEIIIAFGTISIIHILSNKKKNIDQLVYNVLPFVIPLFVLKMMANIIIIGGTIPLIIPGIILVISFIFLPFVYLLEGKKWIEGVLRSSDLTKDFKWSLVWKYIVLFLWVLFISVAILLLFGLIVLITNITELNDLVFILIASVLFPFGLAFSYQLYSELNKIKPRIKFRPSQRGKNIYTFLFIWGCILLLVASIIRFVFPDKDFFSKQYFRQNFKIEIRLN